MTGFRIRKGIHASCLTGNSGHGVSSREPVVDEGETVEVESESDFDEMEEDDSEGADDHLSEEHGDWVVEEDDDEADHRSWLSSSVSGVPSTVQIAANGVSGIRRRCLQSGRGLGNLHSRLSTPNAINSRTFHPKNGMARPESDKP